MGQICDRKSQLSGILTEPLNPRDHVPNPIFFQSDETLAIYSRRIHSLNYMKSTTSGCRTQNG